ncbi:MAG: hypothetical protein JW384_03856 [Nitrosomonadaceae bacterium]|nr:hypothetical protein [Nitrosomonadaceae bacterium]
MVFSSEVYSIDRNQLDVILDELDEHKLPKEVVSKIEQMVTSTKLVYGLTMANFLSLYTAALMDVSADPLPFEELPYSAQTALISHIEKELDETALCAVEVFIEDHIEDDGYDEGDLDQDVPCEVCHFVGAAMCPDHSPKKNRKEVHVKTPITLSTAAVPATS